MDVELQRLRDLNPHLVRGVTPPGEIFPVRVPPGASPVVVASLGRAAGTTWRADD